MAMATGTNVKFVKVQTKQQYKDYTDKDGALIFVESERKIYVDDIAYGFSDSDVANKFLELTGGTMSGDIDMNQNSIKDLSILSFYSDDIAIMQSTQSGGLSFYAGEGGELVLALYEDKSVEFHSSAIRGIPEPVADNSPISKKYLETHVVNKIGVKGGIAGLDSTGKVPSTQLPSYVDDVLEYAKYADFPGPGVAEAGKLYIDLSNEKVYRWGGTAYANVSDGNAHLTLGTVAGTAFQGNLGKVAHDHSQLKSGNPHGVTKSDVKLGSVENYGIASEAEAKAGTLLTKYMTPQRTKQAIETLAPKLSWTVVS